MWYFKIAFGLIVAFAISSIALVVTEDDYAFNGPVFITAAALMLWMLAGAVYICILSLFGGITIIM